MTTRPTVMLVHGAFADASGFASVIRHLQAQEVPVRAPMNPLRGLASDAEAIHRDSISRRLAGRPDVVLGVRARQCDPARMRTLHGATHECRH
jgi:hypothetical protein